MVDFKKLDTSDTGEQDDEAEKQSNEFAALYKESLKERPERDKIIEGTVVRIDQDTVLVDIGLKSEGFVSANEFRDANGEITVQVGERIRVLMTREDGKKGNILSKRKADYLAAWEKIGGTGQQGGSTEGPITARANGDY